MDEIDMSLGPAMAICATAAFLLLDDDDDSRAKRRKTTRTCWVKPYLARRDNVGESNTILKLYQELVDDGEFATLRRTLRMSPEIFQELLDLISPSIRRKNTNFRKAITPEERLCITLRFLALGDSMWSIHQQFRIGYSTVCMIIGDTCKAIYEKLQPRYLKTPSTEQEWLDVAEKFQRMWNVPHVIGALDGKHIRMTCPPNSGSVYYNYKQFYSIVLLAIVDPEYKFLYVDCGSEGHCSDGGIWNKCSFGKHLSDPTNPLHIPPPAALPGFPQNLPYHIIADDAFALTTHVMKPYPGRYLTRKQRIYNYRMCRARRIVENAFGILVAKFAIFRREINMSPAKLTDVVLACTALHNYMITKSSTIYLPTGSTDWEDDQHNVHSGQWRAILHNNVLPGLALRPGNQYRAAQQMREHLSNWFIREGNVPWQYNLAGIR